MHHAHHTHTTHTPHTHRVRVVFVQPTPQVLAFAREAMAQPNPLGREAALSCLAVVCEGCAEPLRKRAHLREVLGHVLAGLADPQHPGVRGAAAFALGMASEFLQPEIVQHYKEVGGGGGGCGG